MEALMLWGPRASGSRLASPRGHVEDNESQAQAAIWEVESRIRAASQSY